MYSPLLGFTVGRDWLIEMTGHERCFGLWTENGDFLDDSGFVARSGHAINTHHPYAEAPTILGIGVPNLSLPTERRRKLENSLAHSQVCAAHVLMATED